MFLEWMKETFGGYVVAGPEEDGPYPYWEICWEAVIPVVWFMGLLWASFGLALHVPGSSIVADVVIVTFPLFFYLMVWWYI